MPVPKSARGVRHRLPGREAARARRTGFVLLALFVVLAGGLAAFFWWADRGAARLGADLCPDSPDFRPPRLVIVLFDQTDPITELQQRALRSAFERLLHREFESEQAQSRYRFSRIEVFSFRAKPTGGLALEQKLALCNPGSVTGLTKFTENPDQVRRRFEQQFRARLDKEIAELLTFKEASQSPILEAIKAVSLEPLAKPRFDGSEKLLVIASDLLHNTPELTLLRNQPSFAEFERTPYGNRMLPNLKGVAVEALVFTAKDIKLQGQRFAEFWAAYLDRAGAEKIDPPLRRIP
jgi:hypothetical protein